MKENAVLSWPHLTNMESSSSSAPPASQSAPPLSSSAGAPLTVEAAAERLSSLRSRLDALDRERGKASTWMRKRTAAAHDAHRADRAQREPELIGEAVADVREEVERAFEGEGADPSAPRLRAVLARTDAASAGLESGQRYGCLRGCVEGVYKTWGRATLWLLLAVTGVRLQTEKERLGQGQGAASASASTAGERGLGGERGCEGSATMMMTMRDRCMSHMEYSIHPPISHSPCSLRVEL